MKYNYDLIVIGSGAGGNVGARYAHELGKRVAVVERGIMGGECPNYACIPANALMHVTDVFNTIKQAESLGIKVNKPTLRLEMVRKWKNLVVRRTGAHRAKATFEKEGIDIIKGSARFVSPHEIEVAGKTYSAANFLLATGASVIVPEIPGLREAGFMMYDQVIDLDRVPKSIFIIGGGVVGLEFAHMYASFGAKVTIADTNPRLMVREDADASNLLTALFENRGITVLTKCEVQEVSKRGDKRVVHYKHKGAMHTTAVDRIVVATGKRPNVDLGLDAAGVRLVEGRLRLNRFMQTNVSHIFAAGDVTGAFMYTHTGEYQSEVAAYNAFHRHKTAIDYRIIPRAVYIDPEIASVGISEQDAAELGIRLKVGVAPLAAIGRANTNDTLDGFVKILATVDGRIVGASIVAPRASEMIHEIAVAMKFRATASDLVDVVHAYPTYSEAIKIACAVIA